MTREPGGRYLIYDAILSLSPLLSPSGKRRLYFLSARDGAESSVNFLFFKTFSLDFALQFREIYTVRKRQSLFDFFYTLCRDDRRDWQDFKISRASRNIYRFQLVAERKKFNAA